MNENTEVVDWASLTPEEKKIQLFLNQKQTLDLFLERGAISQAQYNKSLGDLREKMVEKRNQGGRKGWGFLHVGLKC